MSPTMSYWRRLPPPTCAATTSPAFMPMPNFTGGMWSDCELLVELAGVRRWISIAQSSVRCTWFGIGRRRAEHGEDLVADELEHGAALLEDDLR